MKLNEPITDEEHAAADLEYRRRVETQASFISAIAAKLDAGDSLTELERELAAAVLRRMAEQLAGTKRPRSRGAKKKIPDRALFEYADWIVSEGMAQNAAIEKLAEKWSVSVTAVKKKIGMIGSAEERRAAGADLQIAFRLAGGATKTK